MIGLKESNTFSIGEEASIDGSEWGCAHRRAGLGSLGTIMSNDVGDACYIEYGEACNLGELYTAIINSSGC